MRIFFVFLLLFKSLIATTFPANGNNQFSLDLYQNLDNYNLIFSPFSIYSALSMLYLGADGQTKKAMEESLHFPSSQKKTGLTIGKIQKELSSKLSIVNAVYIDDQLRISKGYSRELMRYFQARPNKAPFKEDSEKALKQINAWVFGKTDGAINNFLHPDDISLDTRLLLINTIFLHKKFINPFDKANTKNAFFYPHSDPHVNLAFMDKTAPYLYFQDDTLQALTLPLEDGFSLHFFLPKAPNELKDLENLLSPQWIETILISSSKENVHIKIPSFTIKKNFTLIDPLKSMGLSNLFSTQANFAKIDDSVNLFLSNVVHEALFSLNEEGIEATAATAAIINIKSIRTDPPQYHFIANHPFIFFITDKNNLILFLGKLTKPEIQ